MEIKYYNNLYEELRKVCDPSVYMNPYDAQRVKDANHIFSLLDNNKNNIDKLVELRNEAKQKLGINFESIEIFDLLIERFNPAQYVGENYNAQKLDEANSLYSAILESKNDIEKLEEIAFDNGIELFKRNKDEKKSNTETSATFGCVIISFMILIILILIVFNNSQEVTANKSKQQNKIESYTPSVQKETLSKCPLDYGTTYRFNTTIADTRYTPAKEFRGEIFVKLSETSATINWNGSNYKSKITSSKFVKEYSNGIESVICTFNTKHGFIEIHRSKTASYTKTNDYFLLAKYNDWSFISLLYPN